MANILVMEDETVLARNICESLQLAGHTATAVADGDEGIRIFTSEEPDVVIIDYRLRGADGLSVLRRLAQLRIPAATIMVTAHGNVSVAVEAMKAGAVDFLTKPIDLETLQVVVDRALRQQRLAEELRYFKERDRATGQSDSLIGDSPAMRRVKEMVSRITATPALASRNPPNLLLTGETGTGKGLLARAIHYAGHRREQKFVHVNCTAIPDHLAESEFFGHVKGAFTDARSDKRGLFELADGGTLFLDEVGHMPLALQSKLLSVLEQRTIRPVGAVRERAIDVHVIAATNRNLDEAIAVREFREDLYHRLRVLRIEVPPLRDRGADLELLAQDFLARASTRYNSTVHCFSDAALMAIRAYDWPGNVRELQYAIESAVLVADGGCLLPEHLALRPTRTSGELTIDVQPLHQTLQVDFAGHPPTLSEIEHFVIRAALAHCNHNLSRAARLLGISRDAVRYRLEKFGKTFDDCLDGETDKLPRAS